MYTRIGRSGGQTTWSIGIHEPKQGELTLAVKGRWYNTETGATVFVTVMLPDGSIVERTGRMEVERTLRVAWGERLVEPIVKVEVVSIDREVVVGSDRHAKNAVEEYVSKVARIAYDAWRREQA